VTCWSGRHCSWEGIAKDGCSRLPCCCLYLHCVSCCLAVQWLCMSRGHHMGGIGNAFQIISPQILPVNTNMSSMAMNCYVMNAMNALCTVVKLASSRCLCGRWHTLCPQQRLRPLDGMARLPCGRPWLCTTALAAAAGMPMPQKHFCCAGAASTACLLHLDMLCYQNLMVWGC
jgi:hypothetical protein